MEYKKDKRTKNLTLRDIHVGDWVHVWSEATERYSPPLKITQICDDGTVYLVTSDEERCTPWEEDIKNVDALEITPELLKGFGLSIDSKSSRHLIEYIRYDSVKIAEMYRMGIRYQILYRGLYSCFHNYFHSFVHEAIAEYPILGELEWKGVKS